MPIPKQQHGLNATGAALVTANDAADLPVKPCTALMITGAAGDLKVTTADGDIIVLPNVPQGILPLGVVRVWATGTLATGIVALY